MQFKNPVLNQIAQDCGLHIDFSNPKATMREIEFFAEKVLKYTESESSIPNGWIKTNGTIPIIPDYVSIQVMFRDLSTDLGRVNHWYDCWNHEGESFDIIAYRILED